MLDHWHRIIADQVRDKRWIITVDVAVSATAIIEILRKYGAEDFFVLAGSPGTGDMPDLPDDQMVLLHTRGPTIMTAIRRYYQVLHELPTQVVEIVDRWDPAREAHVFGSWLDIGSEIAGRPQFGGKTPAWARLEDKIIISDLWRAAGIAHPPYRIVEVEEAAVRSAVKELDRGAGAVITADNKEGWHGGGEMSRTVLDPDSLRRSVSELAPRADVVRVTPFLVGVPCSIHGMVFPDYVLTVRPVEMVTLLQDNRLHYAGTASFWEPDAGKVAAMRQAAVKVGEQLRADVEFRGTFTLDGVLTEDGFLPTELNPRYGAGLVTLTSEADVRSFLVNQMLVAGVEADWRPGDLEQVYRRVSAGRGKGGGFTLVQQEYEETEKIDVAFDGAWRAVTDPDDADGALIRGPAATGGLIRISLAPERTPFGPVVARRVAAAFRLADEIWGTGIGNLRAAADHR